MNAIQQRARTTTRPATCPTCRGERRVYRGLMLDDISGLAVEVPFPASMALFGEPTAPCPDCSGGPRCDS